MALDVYADEPHVPSELLTMDSVVLLPHLGSGTRQTRRAMADLVIRNLTSLLQSGRLVTPVALLCRAALVTSAVGGQQTRCSSALASTKDAGE